MTCHPQDPAVLVNGIASRQLDVADRGLQYGDGVFTTLPVRCGVPAFLPQHLARLRHDAARLHLPFPGEAILRQEAERLIAAHPDSILKIMLTRGVGGRGYRCPADSAGSRLLSVHPLPDYPAEIKTCGIRARVCSLRLGSNPQLAGIKHLNRLEQILARMEWDDDDIREGLLRDGDGFVVEGVMSNLFIVRDGRLSTPLLDRCGVAGVMRGVVLRTAQTLGIDTQETRISLDALRQADEIFVSNSVIGLWPVSWLDGQHLPVGAVTQQLDAAIARL